ncbi:hypothetical protein MN202_00315 [Rheinheimera muenzenbergensis]|uniref:Uncharacterized protein n=1 Tax=Rheinheimera muenzenbergensis TaxID=1193628 RepID=A0ABU8C149_9GAMM
MSSESRIKRLGLEHLKNDPKALEQAIDEAVKKNKKMELLATIEQLEALKAIKNNKDELYAIDAKIKILKNQMETIGRSIEK